MYKKLVSFSGLDGSGKSTQITLLQNKFKQKNKKTKVIWSRGGYTPGFNLLKRILRKIFNKKFPEPGRNKKREQTLTKPLVSKVWLVIAIIDLMFLYVIYYRILFWLNYIVIADRYLIDTIIDFKLNFKKIHIEKWFLWRILESLSPKPIGIYLDIPLEVALKRLEKKKEPFPDSEEILRKRLILYKKYFISSHNYVVNANDTIQNIHNEILTILNEN